MSTVALFKTDEDLGEQNYTWEVSIVEYKYDKSENKFMFKSSFTEDFVTIKRPKAVKVRYLDSGDVRIAVIER